MQRLRAGWLSFLRIHLAALIADWRRTLLSMIGVAVGVTVVLGTLILKSELARPFDSFGPSLTHAAEIGVDRLFLGGAAVFLGIGAVFNLRLARELRATRSAGRGREADPLCPSGRPPT